MLEEEPLVHHFAEHDLVGAPAQLLERLVVDGPPHACPAERMVVGEIHPVETIAGTRLGPGRLEVEGGLIRASRIYHG